MDSEATQSTAFLKFLTWLEVNKKRLVIGGIGFAIIALIASAIIYFQSQREQRASAALSEVKVPFSAGAPSPPGTAEAFLSVANEHAGTKAGARALLMSAGALYQEGKYSEAQALFERFTRDYPTSPWLAQAMFGVASCLDVQQKAAEAAAKFDELRKRFSNDPVADEAKLALARLLEAQNKPAEAYKLYEELAKAMPASAVSTEADVRMDLLVGKHPEVKPAPPQPAIPSVSPITLSTNPLSQLTNQSFSVTSIVRPTASNNVVVFSSSNQPAVSPLISTPAPQPPSSAPPVSPPPSAPAPAPQTPAGTPPQPTPPQP